MILWCGVLLLIGLFMVIWPDYFWMVTEQWKSGDATEPSTLYVISTRFGGIMFIIVGALGLIFIR